VPYISNIKGSYRPQKPSHLVFSKSVFGAEIFAYTPASPWEIRQAIDVAMEAASTLRSMEYSDFVEIFSTAAEILTDGIELLTTDGANVQKDHIEPQAYRRLVALATGLPIREVERSFSTLADYLSSAPEILKEEVNGYTVGDIVKHGKPYGDVLTVNLPSNVPDVNLSWIFALIMGYPVVCRASRHDITPFLLAASLYKAGMPENTIHMLYGNQNLVPTLMGLEREGNGLRSMIFGDENTVKHFKDKAWIDVHGPGASIIVDESPDVGILAELMMAFAGAACITPSTVLVPRLKGKKVAKELHARVSQHEPQHILSPAATLPLFQLEEAEGINHMLKSMVKDGVRVFTANFGFAEKLLTQLGVTRSFYREITDSNGHGCAACFAPTVALFTNSNDPRGRMELPYPHFSVVEFDDLESLAELARNALVAYTWNEKIAVYLNERKQELAIGTVIQGIRDAARIISRWTAPQASAILEFLYEFAG